MRHRDAFYSANCSQYRAESYYNRAGDYRMHGRLPTERSKQLASFSTCTRFCPIFTGSSAFVTITCQAHERCWATRASAAGTQDFSGRGGGWPSRDPCHHLCCGRGFGADQHRLRERDTAAIPGSSTWGISHCAAITSCLKPHPLRLQERHRGFLLLCGFIRPGTRL